VRTEDNSRRDLEIENVISELRKDIEDLNGKINLFTDSYSKVVEALNSFLHPYQVV